MEHTIFNISGKPSFPTGADADDPDDMLSTMTAKNLRGNDREPKPKNRGTKRYCTSLLLEKLGETCYKHYLFSVLYLLKSSNNT